MGRAAREQSAPLAGDGEGTSRAYQLERRLLDIRWVTVALSAVIIWFSYRTYHQVAAPRFLRPSAFMIAGGLVVANIIIHVGLRRGADRSALARLAVFAFAVDFSVVFGVSWLYSFDPLSIAWVSILVVSVEGALRWRLKGAAIVFAGACILEPFRHLYVLLAYDRAIVVTTMMYELGMLALVSLVVGFMAERAERERRTAEDRAREVEMFNDVIVGAAGGLTIDETVQFTVDEMARALAYEHLAFGIVDHQGSDASIRFLASVGFPPGTIGVSLPPGEGITGRVAVSGIAALVGDVREDPAYVEGMPGVRSEMCVPVRARGEVIGVVDVQSMDIDAFSPADLDRLQRLAPQVGLIVSNAGLLARELQSSERLRELDQMKSDFIAITSHELRTPLTTLKGFIRTLRRPDLDLSREQTYDFYATMDKKIDRLIRLIEDLLLASGIDGGVVDVYWEEVAVDDLLADVLGELGQAGRRISVQVTGSWRMNVDAQRISQVLRNLLENALKFSEGPVVLRASADEKGTTFEVSDVGPGIAEEDLERIFDRFQQLGESRVHRSVGVGLGLFITKTLVELLGGEITVSSAEGSGTTFTVKLPSAIPTHSHSRQLA